MTHSNKLLLIMLLSLATFSYAAVHDVSIVNFAYEPQNLTIQEGDSVRWTNNDGVAHTVTSTDDPPVFDSGNMASGEIFIYHFTSAGSYDYFCEIHPYMTGNVEVESATTVEENKLSHVSQVFALQQNYPNPFNNSTTIQYTITGPQSQQVTLAVYDIQGHKVAELVNQRQAQGTFLIKWDGKNQLGEVMSSGIYFYRISSGSLYQSKRMIFLK